MSQGCEAIWSAMAGHRHGFGRHVDLWKEATCRRTPNWLGVFVPLRELSAGQNSRDEPGH